MRARVAMLEVPGLVEPGQSEEELAVIELPMRAEPVRRWVVLTDDRPVSVHGPIEVVLPDGRAVSSDRPSTCCAPDTAAADNRFCDSIRRQWVHSAPPTARRLSERSSPRTVISGSGRGLTRTTLVASTAAPLEPTQPSTLAFGTASKGWSRWSSR